MQMSQQCLENLWGGGVLSSEQILEATITNETDQDENPGEF